MARTQTLKSNFTSGVLDPRMGARADLTHYHNGLELGDNVVIMPHGGVRRRPGLRFIHEIPVAVAGDTLMTAAFQYNATDQQYLLVFADERIYFYTEGALITNINGSGNDYLVSPWPIEVAKQLKWAQSQDTMIIVHEDHAPRTLVRGATDATWTLSTTTFEFVPQIDYNDALSPAPTSEVQRITFSGGALLAGAQFRIDLEGVQTEAMSYDLSGAQTATRIQKALSALYNVATGEVSVNPVSAVVFDVTFSGGSARNYDLMTAYFVSGPTGGTFSGEAVVTQTTAGVPRAEDAWSATRGWPRSVTWFENRLIFGGTKSKPQTVFMSRTNGFYNFDIGDGEDDDAIMRTIDTDQVNQIESVFAGRHLQVYTAGAEFFVPDFPITPEKSSIRPQTTHGATYIDPVQAEGATLFLDLSGHGLYQFLYNDVEAAYTATSLSRLASHLLVSPIDMAFQQPTSDEDANYIYVVNSDGTLAVLNILRSEEIAGWSRWLTDGHFVSCATLRETAYVVVRREDGGGDFAWYVEQFDYDLFTDSAVDGAPAAGELTIDNVRLVRVGVTSLYQRYIDFTAPHGLIAGQQITVEGVIASKYHDINGLQTVVLSVDADTVLITPVTVSGSVGGYVSGGTVAYGAANVMGGLSHLDGIECRVRENGAVALNKTPSGGSITLDTEAVHAEVGRNFDPMVKLMPPYLEAPGHQAQMGRRRYKGCRLNVLQSRGIYVNGYPVPERYMDVDPLDTAPGALTGVVEIRLAGWGELEGIELTQRDPEPMTLRAIEYEMEMH